MEKPDFEKLANERYGYSPDVVDDMSHYMDGMEKIWNTYVYQLQEENQRLKQKLYQLHQVAEFCEKNAINPSTLIEVYKEFIKNAVEYSKDNHLKNRI